MNKKNIITVLTSEEVNDILSHFDVGNQVLGLTRLAGGLANSNYKLTTEKGDFLLKVCDEKTPSQIQEGIEAMIHLKNHSYFTAYPYPLKNQKDNYLYVKGNMKVVIFNFLKGKPKSFEEVNVNTMKGIGSQTHFASTADLHLIPMKENLPPFAMGIAEMYPFIDEVKGTNYENHPFVLFLAEQLKRLQPYIDNPLLPKGILHGDVFPDNALFDGDSLVAIVDWEEICGGAFLIDIGMTICGCCYPKDNKLDQSLVDAFLASYNEIRTLTKLELDLLPYFIDYANLTIAFWRFRQFHIRNPDESLFDLYKVMEARLK